MRTVVDEGEIVCTASLVAKNLAITARHCVAHLVPGDFRCTAQGELESDEPGAGWRGPELVAPARAG
jgi:V8-like Glu-specific endopeptidase